MINYRYGVNDWEKGTSTIWRHKMDLPNDAYFGTCHGFQIQKESVPADLQVEMLGYYNRDNLEVDRIQLDFTSPTWLGEPLQFQADNVGWTSTNYKTFADGGVHVEAPLTLLNPGADKLGLC